MNYYEEKAIPIVLDYSDTEISDEVRDVIKRIEKNQRIIQVKRPFEGYMLEQVKDFYKIDVVWSSEALEGNSLTIGETKVLLEEGITVQGKPLKDVLSTCGHGDAFEFMFSKLRDKCIDIDDIKQMHRFILGREKPLIAGQYKKSENLISGSRYTTIPSNRINEEMETLQKWMKDYGEKMNPVVYAAELHRKLVYIHPFQDGNGRTARLAMNTILIQNGLLPCAISPVLRLEYNDSLEAGRRGETNWFIKFISEVEEQTQKDFARQMNISLNPLKDKSR